MNINDILTQAKAKGTEGIQTAIDDFWKIVREHEAAAGSAIDAYYAGAVKVEDTVKQRLNALTAQQRRINSEISAMGPALTQATISGDNAQLKQIQAKLSELEVQKAATATQIEMLSASQFPNDTRLYKEAAAHREKQLSVLKEVREARLEICRYIKDQIRSLEKVYERACVPIETDNTLRRYTTMYDDFHSKQTIGERLAKREQEDTKNAARPVAVEKPKAMSAETDQKEQDRSKREVDNRPEYFTKQTLGYNIRYRLNRETGEYEEVSRHPNRI